MTDLDTRVLGRDSDVVEIGGPADVAIGLNAIWGAKPGSTRCLPGAACGASRSRPTNATIANRS